MSVQRFFSRHAHLPQQPQRISNPRGRTTWELNRLRQRHRLREKRFVASPYLGLLFPPEDIDPDWDEEDLPHEGSLLDDVMATGRSTGDDAAWFPEAFQAALDGSAVTPSTADGTDSLGSYLPWHWHGSREWGVLIHARPFMLAAATLTNRVNRNAKEGLHFFAVARDLYAMLVEHETFHFEVELAATNLEVGHGRSLYREASLVRVSYRIRGPLVPWKNFSPRGTSYKHSPVTTAAFASGPSSRTMLRPGTAISSPRSIQGSGR